MTPTVYVVRITGLGDDLLSLHTTRQQADTALFAGACKVWCDRFDYDLAQDYTPAGVAAVTRVIESEGWDSSVQELPVEL